MTRAPAPSLVRGLRAWDATSIIVGGIIGSGIFVAPAIVASHVATPGRALLVWVAAGVLAGSGALCYAELGAAMPETGGTYRFLKRAYPNPMVAFLFGWTFFLVDGTGSIAAVAATFAAYAGALLGMGDASTWTLRLVAAGVILLLTVVNYFGVRQSAVVQNVATAVKIAALLAIVAIALFAGSGAVWASPSTVPANALTAVVGTGVAAALVPALFAYDGWTYTSYVAGEMVDPRRNIPRSILTGMAIVIALYLAINLALLHLLPFAELQRSTHVASDAVQRVTGPMGGRLVAAAVMASCIGALNAIVLIYPRIAFAMARDAVFFRPLGRLHPRHQSPANALWLQGLIAAAFAVSGTYEQILGYFAFVEFLFYGLSVAAVIVLRIREPALPRPYKVWAYPLPPLLFLIFGVWYLSVLLSARWGASLVGICLMLTGVPLYFRWRRAVLDPSGGAT